MAIFEGIPNKIKIGVINAPPPTPVMPTIIPTPAPDKIKPKWDTINSNTNTKTTHIMDDDGIKVVNLMISLYSLK